VTVRVLAASCVSLLWGLLLVGCAAQPVRTAPFRARPDSVAAGDLRGPFTGRVIDASSGAPVAGALVYASWTFEAGAGLPIAAGFRDHVASTDANGNYAIPSVSELGGSPPGDARLTDFTLLVYKRGFVAYRSDRRFDDFGPRMDFAQRQNQVRLERWRDDYSHVRHVRYIGGGNAVVALTAWEVDEAIAELSGTRTKGPGELVPGLADGPYVVAAQLLTEADIKAQTRYDGSFETGPLADEPDTASYSSQHFKALGRPESFDIALRLWRADAGNSQQRYEELAETLPNVQAIDEIASRSMRAAEADIRGVAFLDGPRGIVVLLTCGRGLCANVEDAVALTRKVHARIEALWPIDFGGSR
jgi:hypothetical protein